jgi:hypothetical protein
MSTEQHKFQDIGPEVYERKSVDSELASNVIRDVQETLRPFVSESYLYAPFKFNLGVGH